MKKIYKDIPSPTEKDFQFVLDQIAKKNPKVRSYSPGDFIHSSFLDELVKSGYFGW